MISTLNPFKVTFVSEVLGHDRVDTTTVKMEAYPVRRLDRNALLVSIGFRVGLQPHTSRQGPHFRLRLDLQCVNLLLCLESMCRTLAPPPVAVA